MRKRGSEDTGSRRGRRRSDQREMIIVGMLESEKRLDVCWECLSRPEEEEEEKVVFDLWSICIKIPYPAFNWL